MSRSPSVLFVCESHHGSHFDICNVLGWLSSSFTLSYNFSHYKEIRSIQNEVSLYVSKPLVFHLSSYGENAQNLLKETYHGNIAMMLSEVFSKELEKNEEGVIMLGFDADPAGDLMAAMLRAHLIMHGVDPSKILRVVSLEIEEGKLIIIEDSFYHDDQTLAVLNARRRERVFMGVSPRIKEGYRKAFTVSMIEQSLRNKKVERVPVVNMNPEGFGFSTYLAKFALGEE